ncbi:Protein of unknown function [Roseovarius tolerans]|uniref:DUF3768 domain-containing protein n=1 Tax=Roseovarius tolerans TaxID=74031 RepID=A0A1H8JI58_9RHOB|nr:DUF3768 domain-containing protein [Roseovarius tolerans]SEN80135.1 Protein of unknown function [Roseovarius tolerans]
MSPRPTLARQNDQFRSRLGVPVFGTDLLGRFVFTPGIEALSPESQIDIWFQVRDFNVFTEDNDPYGEHDFGAIDHAEAGKVFWKIDYYDPSFTMGSEDPKDFAKTRRVLTVMLASEY